MKKFKYKITELFADKSDMYLTTLEAENDILYKFFNLFKNKVVYLKYFMP